MRGPLMLIAARARRRPSRWLLAILGLGLATAFGGTVAAEGTIAGDEAARAVLSGLSPLQRTVTVTWQGPLTPEVSGHARALLRRLGLAEQAQVVLLNPVRLDGVVVRPAAIEPLRAWTAGPPLGACRPSSCPMLVAGGSIARAVLSAYQVVVPIAGRTELRSAVPLGFTPSRGQPPLLLSGDVAGLDRLPGLGGVYRTHSWLSVLAVAPLHSWQLAGLEQRIQRAQAALLASGSQFSLSAPFSGLDAARAEASAAPRRLLLAGGGALAAIVLFVVLAAGSLSRDQSEELARLRMAGARSWQCVAFAVGESAWLCLASLALGAVVAIGLATMLAGAADIPAGGVLAHSLIAPVAVVVLMGALISGTALLAVLWLAPGRHLADVLALAAVAALVAALARGGDAGGGGGDPLPLLLAPLCCLAAGVLVFRTAAGLLRAGERIARRGPVLLRLSVVGLARAPSAPSLAIAFIAVSTGLGGFALAYRATLLRGTADEAADRVPLDALVSPGPSFATPLQLAPPARWQALAGGAVLPVRRTEATFTSGGTSITVPTLGVPGAGLILVHGWRANDASAPLSALARRLTPPGPVRVRGPMLPPATRRIVLRVRSPGLAVSVSADLRAGDGTITQLPLGVAGPRPATLTATLPRGAWELAALELDEPSGLQITNGHQNGENPGATTQFTATVALGSVRGLSATGRVVLSTRLAGWRGAGAVSVTRGGAIQFSTSGLPGLLRPAQPSDFSALPVLADPQTAAAAGRGGQLELTVDQQSVRARVVGVLRRFPTFDANSGGFIVADQSRLGSALDAQLPGQGRPDELWLATQAPARLRAALATGPLSQLTVRFRADIQRQLRSAPIARGVLGTLIAASVLSGALAIIGLLVALLGAGDPRVEADLVAQGVGPRRLRAEVALRLLLAGCAGLLAGVAIAVLLARLAVATVQAAGTLSAPQPPLVTVAPWGALALWALVAIAALSIAVVVGTRFAVAREAVG